MKSKSHIFMANILREKILACDGRISIDYKSYEIPDDFIIALKNHPQEYRAGAVGPDFFPDMLFGQTQMHPKNSGIWLKRMRDVLSRYPKTSSDYYPALAFYLGYITHYATDLFGHEDVNYYAGGFFPSISDLIVELIKVGESEKGKKDLSIILRHMMIETYMDMKVPKTENLEIEVPLDFIKKCFGSLEAYMFMVENGSAETKLTSFNVLPQMIKNYYKATYTSNTIRGIEKREEYINAWLNIWSTFAKLDVRYGLNEAYEECKDQIIHLLTNYALSFADLEGAGDAVQTVMNIFGLAAQTIADVLTLGLNRLFTSVADRIGELIKERIVGFLLKGIVISLGGGKNDIKNLNAEKQYIRNLFKDPKLILNADRYCEKQNAKVREIFTKDKDFNAFARSKGKYRAYNVKFTDYLDYKWGNYGKSTNIDNQDYKEFKRCLKMGLLCMLGANNLNKLFTLKTNNLDYTFEGTDYKHGTYSVRTTIVMQGNMYADTSDDVYLEIGDGRESYRFLLDHGGKNDFKSGSVYNYDIYLPEFIPYSSIKSVSIVKFGTNDADFKAVYVTDRSTGKLIARSNSFSLTNKVQYKDLRISDNLLRKDTSDFDHLAGIYMVYFGNDTLLEKELTLKLYTKSGYENSWTHSFYRINEGYDIKYFPLFSSFNDIKKIEYTLDSRKTLDHVYLFEGTSFRCISYIDELKKDDKPHDITLKKINFKGISNGWYTRDLGVIVKTSENLFSGTDDNIRLWITFKNDKPDYIDFDKGKDYNANETGNIEFFYKKLKSDINVQDIEKFSIIKEGKYTDYWTIDFIALVDLNSCTPLFVQRFAGPTVMEARSSIDINDGFWKKTIEIRY